MPEADAHLERAGEALAAARLASDAGLSMDAVSRAYYAMYDACRALLASAGLAARTHKGLLHRVREAFGDRLGPENLQSLAKAQALRESSDYEAAFRLSSGEAADVLEWSHRFLEAA